MKLGINILALLLSPYIKTTENRALSIVEFLLRWSNTNGNDGDCLEGGFLGTKDF